MRLLTNYAFSISKSAFCYPLFIFSIRHKSVEQEHSLCTTIYIRERQCYFCLCNKPVAYLHIFSFSGRQACSRHKTRDMGLKYMRLQIMGHDCGRVIMVRPTAVQPVYKLPSLHNCDRCVYSVDVPKLNYIRGKMNTLMSSYRANASIMCIWSLCT